MKLPSLATVLESRGFTVRPVASSDGQEWLSVTVGSDADLAGIASALPSSAVAIRSSVDGVVLVALATLAN
jgi:hypothetical protein